MNDKPHISVIMPIYNMATYLPQSFNSVSKQTLKTSKFYVLMIVQQITVLDIGTLLRKQDARIKMRQLDRIQGRARLVTPVYNAQQANISPLDPDDLCRIIVFMKICMTRPKRWRPMWLVIYWNYGADPDKTKFAPNQCFQNLNGII